MEKTAALSVLEDALERCRRQDMRMAEVYRSLDFLEAHAVRKWPFDQFRDALENSTSEEGQWQVLNASLNAIRLALTNQPESTGKRREWVFEPPPRRHKT